MSLYGASTSVSIGLSAPFPGQEGTLAVDRSVPGVVSFSGRLASPVVDVPTGVSLPVSVDATLDADIPPSASNAIWDANVTANFPTQGPAFDLPADFSANGSDVVDNAWTAPGTITTVAGGGTTYGDGGLATAAQLSLPQGIAVDGAGNIVFADYDAFVVRRVDGATGVITTIAGVNGVLDFLGGDGDGGPATSATLGTPLGVSLDAAGNVYLADQLNNRIRKVDMSTGIITTVAGTSSILFSGDGGQATLAGVAPEGVALDGSGNMYIADTGNLRIRKVNAAGIITTIAGTGNFGTSGDGGSALAASFSYPSRVAVDGAGNVFVLDSGSAGGTSRIRRIATNGIITTVAGGGASDGTSGSPTAANLGTGAASATDVDVDANGVLFIAGQLRVWKADLALNTISSVAGTGTSGFSGDGGDATLARFAGLGGVAVGTDGSFWVSDSLNHRVRKILVPPPPPPPPRRPPSMATSRSPPRGPRWTGSPRSRGASRW